jgi:hypothetical protein
MASMRPTLEPEQSSVAWFDRCCGGTSDAGNLIQFGKLITDPFRWRNVVKIVVELLIKPLRCCFEILQVTLTENSHQIPSNAIPPWLKKSCKGRQADRMFRLVPFLAAGRFSFDKCDVAFHFLRFFLCFADLPLGLSKVPTFLLANLRIVMGSALDGVDPKPVNEQPADIHY